MNDSTVDSIAQMNLRMYHYCLLIAYQLTICMHHDIRSHPITISNRAFEQSIKYQHADITLHKSYHCDEGSVRPFVPSMILLSIYKLMITRIQEGLHVPDHACLLDVVEAYTIWRTTVFTL